VETAVEAEFHAYLDAGDLRQAGTWLVQRHARDVLGLCGAMVRDPTTAEDLTQDVFGKAFSGLGAYRREASSRTWLLAIARNRCIRALRRDPWRGAPPDDASADPDRVPDAAPLPAELLTSRGQVEAALDELAEGERALVVLRYRHGLDYRELAHVFGIRPATLRMRLSRALNKMRHALERATDEDTGRLAVASLAAMDAPHEAEDALELYDLEAPARATPPPASSAPSPASSALNAKARRLSAAAPRRRGFFSRLFSQGGAEDEQANREMAAPTDPLAAALGADEIALSGTLVDQLVALANTL
jgi:RNA polymerase sigma-70 factor (ECF subfamily)